jgi:hypothetical protein
LRSPPSSPQTKFRAAPTSGHSLSAGTAPEAGRGRTAGSAGWRTAPDRVPASGQAFALIEREVERSGEVESKVINHLVLPISAIDEVKMLDHEDDVGQNRRPKPR